MIRNQLVIVTMVLAFAASPARAQFLEVTPFYGVQIGGGLETEQGDLVLGNSDNFGLGVGLRLSENAHLEVSYTRQDTKLRLKGSPFSGDTDLFDISSEYYQIGAVFETTKQELARMYGLVSFGVTRFNPKDTDVTGEWRISGAVGGGFKTFVNRRFGLRAQMRILGTFIDSTGGLYCDEDTQSPDGCYNSVGGSQVVIQGDFTLGLIIVL